MTSQDWQTLISGLVPFLLAAAAWLRATAAKKAATSAQKTAATVSALATGRQDYLPTPAAAPTPGASPTQAP